MDQNFVKICREKKKEGLNRREYVEDLSRSKEIEESEFFKKGKTYKDECIKQATQPKIQSTY